MAVSHVQYHVKKKKWHKISSFHKQQLLLYDNIWHPLQNVVQQSQLTHHDHVHCLGGYRTLIEGPSLPCTHPCLSLSKNLEATKECKQNKST